MYADDDDDVFLLRILNTTMRPLYLTRGVQLIIEFSIKNILRNA